MSEPLSFMKASSDKTLADFELHKRNLAANLQKQIRALIAEYVDEIVEAELARAWRDARKELCLLNHKSEDMLP